MNDKNLVLVFGLIVLVVAVLLTSGCSYMKNRGNDALDIVDLEFTVNDRLMPQVAIYFNFFSYLPLGYANVEGMSFGIGDRQIGLLDYEHHSWGAILVGREKQGSGEFNPEDPRQARPDQSHLTEAPAFDVGAMSISRGEERPPTLRFMECNRFFHFGWIGLNFTVRPADLVDFLVGWTTLDILGDDVHD